MLGDNQEVSVGRVERFLAHVLSGGIEQDTQTLLRRGVTRSRNQVQAVNPVHRLIQIKRVPAKLVGDMVQLGCFRCQARVVRIRILGREVLVGGGREDSVNPGLLVFVSGGREGRSRELLCIQAVGRLLRRVLAYRESSLDGLGPVEV